MDATVCPKHGVPTVADGVFDKVDPLVGKTFSSSYRIEGLLGEGAMGRVYRATQISMGRIVALKTLHAHLVSDRDLMRRFYREARSASQLLSPHVVRVFDFGVDDETGTPYIAMEILEGSDLGDLIKGEGPLAVGRAARLLLQVSQALREAERKGIVHRDLKPDNVFVSTSIDIDDDFVKVVDFGIAKVLGAGSGMTSDLTATGKTVGTPQFMAPEQVRGGDVDIRADLYSLGCILHTVLTGLPPFHGDDAMSIMMRHLSAPAPPLPSPRPGGEVPPKQQGEQHSALLAKRVEDRPASADVVYRALRAIERQQDIALATLAETAGARTTASKAVTAGAGAAARGSQPVAAAGFVTRELDGASPSARTQAADLSVASSEGPAVMTGDFSLDEDPLDALSSLAAAWPGDEQDAGGSSVRVPSAMATGAAHEAMLAPPTVLPPTHHEKVPIPLIVLAALVLLGVAGGGAWYLVGGAAAEPSETTTAADQVAEERAGQPMVENTATKNTAAKNTAAKNTAANTAEKDAAGKNTADKGIAEKSTAPDSPGGQASAGLPSPTAGSAADAPVAVEPLAPVPPPTAVVGDAEVAGEADAEDAGADADAAGPAPDDDSTASDQPAAEVPSAGTPATKAPASRTAPPRRKPAAKPAAEAKPAKKPAAETRPATKPATKKPSSTAVPW